MVLRNSGRVGRRRVFLLHKSPSHKDGLLCCVAYTGWSKGRKGLKGPKRACYGS